LVDCCHNPPPGCGLNCRSQHWLSAVTRLRSERGASGLFRAGCLGNTLLEASGRTRAALAKLNGEINRLRNAVYHHIGGWAAPEAPAEAD
jgi:hypothetical protein